jgi:hypothetical protein
LVENPISPSPLMPSVVEPMSEDPPA